MKQIRIEEQPVLSFGRIVRLTVDGIRYRLFRASVTVAVIAVAVAFLANVLGESLFKREVAVSTRDRISKMRLAHVLASRISTPPAIEDVLREIAGVEESGPVYGEFMKMGSISASEVKSLQKDARQAMGYLDFFAGLDYDRRRRLIHTARGVEIFERLGTAKGMGVFRRELDSMKSVSFVTTVDVLQEFLRNWPEVRKIAERVRCGRAAAVGNVKVVLAGRSVFEGLSDADGAFGRAIQNAGFSFEPKTTGKEIAVQVEQVNRKRLLESTVEVPAMCKAIAARKNIMPSDVTTIVMWDMLGNKRTAAWYLSKMEENGLDRGSLDGDDVAALADLRLEETALSTAERLTAGVEKGLMGLGERMGWLLLVSMLLCAVGISNAMLMTVTERFREIATLKCLGALDGFIMVTFVLEACFMGVVGGLVGGVAGSLISLGRMAASFGVRFLSVTPFSEMVTSMLVFVLVGAVLAAVSAVYPAYKAARLAPMEAMRIE